jgi:hypothetical protein
MTEMEQARADRLATAQACAKKPGDQALIDADNLAQAKVHELELQVRTEEEARQFAGIIGNEAAGQDPRPA